MRIILIGNYPKDRQESMIRFSEMLFSGFSEAGLKVEIWNPVVLLGKNFASTTNGLGKWMGYIDKWLIFPLLLKCRLLSRKSTRDDRYHICDHSNAAYLNYLPRNRTSITCHDVLAIRGAMGHADAYCQASKTGKIFQRWILKNLLRARLLAAVSQKTLNQLRELGTGQPGVDQKWKVIYNAFNNDFGPLDKTLAEQLLQRLPLQPDVPFLLHVGSDLPRKNRKLLLDMIALPGSEWDGIICFAGDALEPDLAAYAQKKGLQDRYISVVKPDHKTLRALYCTCAAFVFPSFSEGFGWPVIEAQACGAPVIASNIEPMPEVSGGAALYADPADPVSFANALNNLMHRDDQAVLIQAGYKNCLRFEPRRIIDHYLELQGLKRTKL